MVGKIKSRPAYFILLVAFFFFAIAPLLYAFADAFFSGNFQQNFRNLFSADSLLLLLKSLGIAISVSLLSLFFGSILSVILYKTDIPFRSFFKILFLLPLFISPYIWAVAWKDFFSFVLPRSASIPPYLETIAVLTFIYAPLAMLIIGTALINLDKSLEESAFVVADFRSAFTGITLPLVKPAFFTAFTLVFIFSISEFSVPAFFGTKVFTTEIFTQFSAFYRHSFAVFQSSLLIIICAFLLSIEKKQIAEASFISIGTKGTKGKIYGANKSKLPLTFTLAVIAAIALGFPLSVLFSRAFTGNNETLTRAFDMLKPAFADSLALAFISAALSVIIGFVAAFYSAESRGKIPASDWLLLTAFAVPSIVFGIGLIKFYNRPAFNFIYSSYAIIVIAYVGKFSFISAKFMENALKQIPPSLDEAATMLGVSKFDRIKSVLMPLSARAIFGAFAAVFVFALGELGATIMIYPPGTELMSVKVFTIMANAPQSLVSAMTLISLGVTLAVIFVFLFIAKFFVKNYDFAND